MNIVSQSVSALTCGLLMLALMLPATPPAHAQTDPLFTQFQTLPTVGTTDWEGFRVGSDHYLVVANSYDGGSVNHDSHIYKWDGTQFAQFQTIPTTNARAWESFTIGGNVYLAVAQAWDGSSFEVDSKIYQWNGTQFAEFQTITTQGALDWHAFSVGSDHYLVVANTYDGTTHQTDSVVYKWNGTQFVAFQTIPTVGAIDWESFTIGSDTYLAVANNRDGNLYTIDSHIYKWDGTQFVQFQTIPTKAATDWEAFSIGSDAYLAVSYEGDGTSSVLDSEIFKWDGTQFVLHQSIETKAGWDWHFLTLNGVPHLVVANRDAGGGQNVTDSVLYEWDGSLFVQRQTLSTVGASDWASLTIGNDTYLVVANHIDNALSNPLSYQLDSVVYRALDTAGSGDIEAKVTIQEGDVTIGAPSLIQFPDTGVSDAEQTVDVTVTDHFFVKDLKAAAAGYFTTLSVSDMVDGSKTIAADNMEIRVENGTVEALEGTADPNVTVPTATQTYTQFTSSSPVTLLQRSADSSGLVGKYGVLPDFQLTIPAYQSLGSYTATMTYTLIEN